MFDMEEMKMARGSQHFDVCDFPGHILLYVVSRRLYDFRSIFCFITFSIWSEGIADDSIHSNHVGNGNWTSSLGNKVALICHAHVTRTLCLVPDGESAGTS